VTDVSVIGQFGLVCHRRRINCGICVWFTVALINTAAAAAARDKQFTRGWLWRDGSLVSAMQVTVTMWGIVMS